MEACSRLVGTSRVCAAFSVDAGLSEYDCGGGNGGAFMEVLSVPVTHSTDFPLEQTRDDTLHSIFD